MTRGLELAAAALAFVAGVALTIIYTVLVVRADDLRDELVDIVMIGVGGVFLIALSLIWIWSARRRARRDEGAGSVWIPPIWLGLAIFGLAVGLGFATIEFDFGIEATPILGVIAAAAIAFVVLRFAAWWAPRRRGSFAEIVRTGVWGMIGATTLSGLAQALAFAALIGGLTLGLYIHDPDLATGSPLQDALQEVTESENDEVPEILTTPTIALGLFGLIAIIAPLSEELLKFLGVVLVMGRRANVTAYSAFMAGVAAGLGFAVVEALGYALIAPLNWPQVMLIRAPVVIIHVAATSIVAMGWYQQRQHGGVALLWYYGIAVLLHAGWNGMFVALLLTGAGVGDTADPDVASAMALLALVSGLATLWIGSVLWIVLNARRLARASDDETTTIEVHQSEPLDRYGATPGASLVVQRRPAGPLQY